MKFNVPTKEFEKAIGLAGSSVAAKGPRPVLACLKIEAIRGETSGIVRITGTDLQTMMTVDISVAIDADFDPGDCLVPAKLMRDVVSGLGSVSLFPEITVRLEEDGLRLINTNSEFAVLNTMDPTEFPNMMAKANSENALIIEASELERLLSSAVVAVKHGESGSQGNVCLTCGAGLQATATDGHRMVVAKLHDYTSTDELDGVHLVPEAAVHRVLAMSKGAKDVAIGKVGEVLVFTVENVMLATRLYDGKSPDPKRILPKTAEYLVASASDFSQALEVVAPLASLSSGMVFFVFSKVRVEVSAESRESGSIRTAFNLKKPRITESDDEEFRISFNIRFLKDFLKINTSEEISIGLQRPSLPAMFSPSGYTSPVHLQYVVIPMTAG